MNNLFSNIPADLPDEVVETLFETTSLRIERIVSDGHASAHDFWYDQHQHEWVLLLQGEGERACPPEDAGGPWGYPEYLAALADPTHEQHEDYLEWSGPFDPVAFSAAEATQRMQEGLPDWRAE